MQDSFRVRVDKAFGSLSTASTSTSTSSLPEQQQQQRCSSSSLSSLWSLTDDEIEPQPWNRDTHYDEQKKSELLASFPNGFLDKAKSSVDYQKLLEKELEELKEEEEDDDDVGEGSSGCHASSSNAKKSEAREEEFDDEELGIKSSIGLDPTLDNEEEEDEYDKVAVGKEKAGDRLHMKDINDYETDADCYNPLPRSFRDVTRDPRANIIAAKVRLKEDAEAAKKLDAEAAMKINSLQVSEDNERFGDKNNIKSILKRKEDQLDSKSQKRVRFDGECKNGSDKGAGQRVDVASLTDTSSVEEEAKGSLIKVSSTDEKENAVDGLPMDTCSMEEDSGNLTETCAEGAKDIQVEAPSPKGDNILVEAPVEGTKEIVMEAYPSKEAEDIPLGADGTSLLPQDHPPEVPQYLRNPLKYTHYTFDSSSDMDAESNRQAYMDFLKLLKMSKTTELLADDDSNNFPKSVSFIPKRKSGGAAAGDNKTDFKNSDDASRESENWKGLSVGIPAMDAVVDDVCAMEEDEQEIDADKINIVRRPGRQYRTKLRMESHESEC